MEKYKKVIFGGTCRAVGELLQAGGDCLLIERSASIGGEFFDSYKKADNWDSVLDSEFACEFRSEMEGRKMIRGDQTDFYGLAPLIYNKLKDYTESIMLMTELAEIKKIDEGFNITVYNQSGKQEIHCEEVIDASVLCVSDLGFGKGNIQEKKLNAIIYTDNSEQSLTGSIPEAELSAGRNEKELILRMSIDRNIGFAEAREQLLNAWGSRSAELKGCRINSIAKEFDYEFKENTHQFAENWQYVNPINFSNPLLAIDAGKIS
jgi:hypothetical protein